MCVQMFFNKKKFEFNINFLDFLKHATYVLEVLPNFHGIVTSIILVDFYLAIRTSISCSSSCFSPKQTGFFVV